LIIKDLEEYVFILPAQTVKLIIMTTLRVFAYMIAPITDKGVTNQHFQAIQIANDTAQQVAKMYGGRTDCSSCGNVQYSDTVIRRKQEITNCISFYQKTQVRILNPFTVSLEITSKG
jgi:hypothetical protein